MSRKIGWILLALLVAVQLPREVLAQERGTVTGTVVDATTARPLPGVQITVAGTQLGTLTNQQGRFVIPNVPAGTREVRATLIGYTQATQTVSVPAGASVSVDLQLRETAIAVEGVIVTATGETQRRREIGNAVSQINVQDVELGPVTNVAQLLQARTPGVTVQMSSGTTGGSQRIRIRGSNSVSLSNEPLIIIDGVRINNSAQSSSIAVGGQDISRMNDLNPDEIENIEILRGPAAAALYGTAAANGVIQITTRRGRQGAPRWSAYTELGTLSDPTNYPANFGRTAVGGANTRQCTLHNIATGACANPSPDLLVYAPLEGEANPFRTGNRAKFGVNVGGGGDVANYFLSIDNETENGVYANNWMERTNLRSNVTARLREDLDATVTVGFVNNQISMPQNDNNTWGQIGGALLGVSIPTNTDAGGNQLFGYCCVTPQQVEQTTVGQDARRFTGGLQANYRPLPWLSFVHQSGIDALFRHDQSTIPQNLIFTSGTAAQGSRTSNRAEVINMNVNLGATANYALRPELSSTSSAGFQYQRELFQRSDAFGANLLPGTTRLTGTSARFAVSESFTDNRTIGAYLQQQFGYQDRIFVTGALRGDDNSAFGSDFGLVVYPSISASWVIAEEAWFPEQDFVSTLRLRSALGSSGLRPTFRDAISFFQPVGATVQGQDVPAFTVGGIGDPNLRPEFTTEFEAGLDAGFLNERLGLELTYYNKRSRDALIFRRLPPSIGAARGELGTLATGRFENIGRVSNQGVELLARATPVQLPSFSWDVTATFSTNRNRLVELGEGIEPIIFGLGGATQRHQPDFPLGGYWGRPMLGFNDANGDGVIQRSEVELAAEAEFLGSPMPTREFTLSSDVTLGDLVRVSALLDGKGGHLLNNSTRFFRCTSSFVNCREAFDPTAPLFDQARAVIGGLERSVYFEEADYVKLREVAVTLMAPEAWNRRLRTQGLSVMFSGRNLATWTDYTGFDPELNFAGGDNFSTADFLTQPPLRYFTARVNLNF